MTSREKILSAVKKNQPEDAGLPELSSVVTAASGHVDRFKTVLTNIGGVVVEVRELNGIQDYVLQNFPQSKRVVSTIPNLSTVESINDFKDDPHLLENVDLAILQGHFGVAENGGIWITEDRMGNRALPFITQHLALVINKNEIVPTLHEAYERIGEAKYELGTFIAGPSKTADIEQSLVLGAHGPKSLVVFLVSR